MDKIKIIDLDPKRFNALAAQSRSPAAAYISEELAYYADEHEIVLGVVLRDTIDNDFVGILLGRDEGNRFRAFDLKVSIETQEQATSWVKGGIKWHVGKGVTEFPQGDHQKNIDLFTPIVPIHKQHLYFSKLSQEESFSPAKTVINELMSHFVDIDGNFVEQFQSTGFDARLWELYLNTYLNEEQLFFNRDHNAPDFIVEKYGMKVAIEAVIVGRKTNNPVSAFKVEPKLLTPSEIEEKHENEMPIKFGSPLYSKLRKKYWNLEQVKGNPLVFAIADFHDDQSMLWSSNALINYLYGVKHDFEHDPNGQLIISPIKIEKHKLNGKEIPSGFFFQPDSENVSAILFSASGTISKFNRIGKQAGFGSDNIIMYRFGTYHDHNPNASIPKPFVYQVTTKSKETWAEGLSMFHNPNAKFPVPEELFPSIAHHHFKEGQIVSSLPEFHPYSSTTMNVKLTK
ncbi:glycosaminoglycan attachment protein [Aeromonas salmonicida subsp. pectinolytica]